MSTTTVSYSQNYRLLPHIAASRFNKSLKPISLLRRFPISKSFFSISRPSRKNRNWASKTMAELIRVSAMRSSNDVEEFGGLETDAILSIGSSEFRPTSNCATLQSTLNKSSKWLVAILFAAAVLWKHDGEAMWATIGSVLNALLSFALKRLLNQERPLSTSKSDPGMPSSHAQSIFFAIIFAIISMVRFLGLNDLTVIAGMIVLALGSYLSWLRVAQHYHTINQVVVGALVGTFFSMLWFLTWDAVVLNAFISYFWIQIIVFMASVVCVLSFLGHVIQHWLTDERRIL